MATKLKIEKRGDEILIKRKKLAEKISQKNPEYMLNYSLPCSCS
jgi:hypothetical protein